MVVATLAVILTTVMRAVPRGLLTFVQVGYYYTYFPFFEFDRSVCLDRPTFYRRDSQKTGEELNMCLDTRP